MARLSGKQWKPCTHVRSQPCSHRGMAMPLQLQFGAHHRTLLKSCERLSACLSRGIHCTHTYTPIVRRQFLINLPGGWECRRTLHNVLRVSWLDVFEQFGWTVRSAWNTDKTTGFHPPEPSAELKELPAGDFKGECASFLLSKGARPFSPLRA
jgi:hypothetical protein